MAFLSGATDMSSSGDMKMSLKLITWEWSTLDLYYSLPKPHIFMTQVLEEFQLSVCALRQDRSAEGFHDLLDSHSLTGELIFCGAMNRKDQKEAPRIELEGRNTRQGQRLPCPQVGGRCTCFNVNIVRSGRIEWEGG